MQGQQSPCTPCLTAAPRGDGDEQTGCHRDEQMLVNLPWLINYQVSPTAGHRLHLLVSPASHMLGSSSQPTGVQVQPVQFQCLVKL